MQRIAHYAEKQSSNFCVVLSNPHQLFAGDYGGRWWGVNELVPPIQVPQQSIKLFQNLHFAYREAEARAISGLIFRRLSLSVPVEVSKAITERSTGLYEIFVATSKLKALTPGPPLFPISPTPGLKSEIDLCRVKNIQAVSLKCIQPSSNLCK